MSATKRIYFSPPASLLGVIEQFVQEEFCNDRSEAVTRMVGFAAKQWLASRGASNRVES